MADNVIINPGVGGAVVATDEIAGAQYQRVKLIHGNNGINDGDVSSTNGLPVQGPVTDAQLRASALVYISYEHNKTHEGRYFSGGYYNSNLLNNTSIDILFNMGLETFHTQLTSSAAGDCIIEIFENTVATGGTIINMDNHNRMSSKVFIGTIKHSATITNTGDKLDGTGYLVGGQSKGSNTGSGGSFGFSNEYILAPNTSYLFRLTNISNATIRAAIHIEGYQPFL